MALFMPRRVTRRGKPPPLPDYVRALEHQLSAYLPRQQVAACGRRYDVDPEAVDTEPAQPPDLSGNQFGRLPHHAEKAEAPGGGDGGHQLRPRDATHAREDDRPAAAEHVAEGIVGKVLHDSLAAPSSKSRRTSA